MSRAGRTMWMISELSQEAVLKTSCLCNWPSPRRRYREERAQKVLTMRAAVLVEAQPFARGEAGVCRESTEHRRLRE